MQHLFRHYQTTFWRQERRMIAFEDLQAIHGWTAVDRNPSLLISARPYINKAGPLLIQNICFPAEDNLVHHVQLYAREKLPLPTYHHFMRVFYFGRLEDQNLGLDRHLDPFMMDKSQTYCCDSIGNPPTAVPRTRQIAVPLYSGSHRAATRKWDHA